MKLFDGISSVMTPEAVNSLGKTPLPDSVTMLADLPAAVELADAVGTNMKLRVRTSTRERTFFFIKTSTPFNLSYFANICYVSSTTTNLSTLAK